MELMKYAIEGYKNVKSDKYIGIFGNPIKHTLSPVIHNTLSEKLGIDEKYVPFHITGNLGDAVKLAYDEGILGLNITVPYKQEVIPFLTDISPEARAIGAVNTLVRTDKGYKGYNTDMPGLARAILSEGISLIGSKVVIIGAGGAARAVSYMCLSNKATEVFILNRTYDKAREIADDMNKIFDCNTVKPVDVKNYRDIPVDRYIFIQCTSVGLKKGDGLPLIKDDEFYKMAYCGVDLIYNPARTDFIKTIEKSGGVTLNGLKMLLYQGIMAYELWNNVKISGELTNLVYDKLKKSLYRNNIVLTGFMGSGKTTAGRYIEKEYGYTFLDTDEYIEKKEGCTISEIFKKKGEKYFRSLETEILTELSEILDNTVLSTGGGMPLREENAVLLENIGKVFFLDVEADTVYERLKGDKSRPLLLNYDSPERIKALLKERATSYKQGADYIIKADNKSCRDICREIIMKQNQ